MFTFRSLDRISFFFFTADENAMSVNGDYIQKQYFLDENLLSPAVLLCSLYMLSLPQKETGDTTSGNSIVSLQSYILYSRAHFNRRGKSVFFCLFIELTGQMHFDISLVIGYNCRIENCELARTVHWGEKLTCNIHYLKN